MALLSNTFAIDVCAYAILSNHSHTVLKINESLAQSWTDEQVIQRWEQLFSIPVLVERYLNGECHSDVERDKAQETIALFRDRLMDISWFMRCLNEHIARKANVEDNCLFTLFIVKNLITQEPNTNLIFVFYVYYCFKKWLSISTRYAFVRCDIFSIQL